jgi:hypothetical protein
MGLFLDIIRLSPQATDNAMESIYKALSDGHDHDGWEPHESPLIRRMIELFTQRGLDRLDSVKKEIDAWAQGQRHAPKLAPVPIPPGAMGRWNDAELALVRIYLEALPPSQWTLGDHMRAVDYVVQRYLPESALVTEAQWLTTRAALMGKVQANMKDTTAKQADVLMAAMPSTVGAATQMFPLAPRLQSVMEFAAMRAVENVRALTDGVRHRMRSVVLQHLELGPAASGPSLQSKLLDAFGILNRDWRRIAVTEAGEAQTAGYIASLPLGAKVKRVEQYNGACSFCRKIDGRVMTIVDAAKPEKNPDTEIWAGKTNVGRSASPRKRVGDVLVEREPSEMWQVPVGLVHPSCRGRWVLAGDADVQPGDDPDFADWLSATLAPSASKAAP